MTTGCRMRMGPFGDVLPKPGGRLQAGCDARGHRPKTKLSCWTKQSGLQGKNGKTNHIYCPPVRSYIAQLDPSNHELC
jgi:hypothetical protein